MSLNLKSAKKLFYTRYEYREIILRPLEEEENDVITTDRQLKYEEVILLWGSRALVLKSVVTNINNF